LQRWNIASDNVKAEVKYIDAAADRGMLFGTTTDHVLAFQTNNTERLRITSDGKVGINLISPQTTFHSSGTTNGQQATFGSSSSGLKISTFQKTDNDAGVILDAQRSSNGTLTFATAGTERLRITSAGEVQISNGNLKFSTAGTGIDFSANANAAGMTSELLDDYEEGTWLPSIGGTATYDIQWGYYIKIGKSVQCWGGLRPNSMGTGNAKQIQNLPFTAIASPATTMTGGGAIVWHDNCPTSITNTPALAVQPNSTYANINTKTAASTTLQDSNNFWQNNHRANFFITYQTN